MRTEQITTPQRARAVVLCVCLLGMTAILLAGCDKKKPAVAKPVAVVVTTAQQRDVPAMVRAVGTFQADQIANISCELSGTLIKLGFKDGQRVKQGDLIAQLDQTLQQATLESMTATAKEKKWVYQAKLKAQPGGGVSNYELEQARLELDTAVANQNAAQATLDKLTVRAPFDGRLGIHKPDVGTYLDAGDPIVQLVNDNPMLLDYSVPDRATDKLKVGQPVFQVDNHQRVREGKVVAINPAINIATRSLLIRAAFPNKDGKLISGGFIKAQHQTGMQKNAVIIPQEAVTQTQTGAIVYVITDKDIAKQTNIQLGIYIDDMVVVEKGLNVGQTVVLRGWQKLRDGISVKRVPLVKVPNAPEQNMPTPGNAPGSTTGDKGASGSEGEGGRS